MNTEPNSVVTEPYMINDIALSITRTGTAMEFNFTFPFGGIVVVTKPFGPAKEMIRAVGKEVSLHFRANKLSPKHGETALSTLLLRFCVAHPETTRLLSAKKALRRSSGEVRGARGGRGLPPLAQDPAPGPDRRHPPPQRR